MFVCWLGDFRPHTHTPLITKESVLVMNASDTKLTESDNEASLLKAHGILSFDLIRPWPPGQSSFVY